MKFRRSRKALAYTLLGNLGVYRRLGPSAELAIDRYVFVCTGNICRSPLAQAVCESMGAKSISFGIDAIDGRPADPIAIKVAQGLGIELREHVTRRFDPRFIRSGDVIFCMSPDHVRLLTRRWSIPAPIKLLGLWADSPEPHIFDPFNLSESRYKECFELIRQSVENLASAQPTN